MKWQLFTAFSLFLLLLVQQLVAADLDVKSATKAVESAKGLIDKLKGSSIVQKVQKYGPLVGFIAGAVVDTVSFIKTLVRGGVEESKELKFLIHQFAIVNTKLDALDHEFETVKSLIDWNSMRTNVMQYENDIKALEDLFFLYLDSPIESKKSFEQIFHDAMVAYYRDAPLKLYYLISKEGGIFHENFFGLLQTWLKNHHAQIAEVTGYILRLMDRGLTLEFAHLSMLGDQPHIQELNQTWTKRFESLRILAAEIDQKIINAWRSQYRIDADQFVVQNAGLTNSQMAHKLNEMLTKKYPLRQWFVLVYTFTNNNDKDRFFDNCGEFSKVNVGNKVVVVNSMDVNQTQPRINIFKFYNGVSSTQGLWAPKARIARRLFYKVSANCKSYLFRGVFEEKANVQIVGPRGHYTNKRVHVLRAFHSWKPYLMFVFA